MKDVFVLFQSRSGLFAITSITQTYRCSMIQRSAFNTHFESGGHLDRQRETDFLPLRESIRMPAERKD